jgi:hypothetical protein
LASKRLRVQFSLRLVSPHPAGIIRDIIGRDRGDAGFSEIERRTLLKAYCKFTCDCGIVGAYLPITPSGSKI